MRRSLSRTPVLFQVLLLVFASIVAAQAANAFVVLSLPEPLPSGFSVQEAARALKGETVRLRDGKRLRSRLRREPPAFGGPRDPLGRVLETLLAEELGVDPSRVRVEPRIPGPPRERIALHARMVHSHEAVRREVFVMRSERHAHGGDTPSPFVDRLVFPPFAAALRSPDGGWAVVEPPSALLSPWHRRLLLSFLLTALLVAPLAWWFARRLTQPIRAFAGAAERLGADPDAPPMPAEGPTEVRAAVHAFNDMQEKLRLYVQGRTEMIAAIAHDLRTPLTRLRFRAEAAPEEVRDKIAADVEQMDGMIASVLAFVRGETGREAREPVDLAALVASVADDAAETGGAVTLEEAQPATVAGDAVALRRLLTNLIDNAVKFAGGARVSLVREGAWAMLRVDDDGPGLPGPELERAFEPFHRGEPSRNRETGGAGLGLSVVRGIARAHGGDARLENRPEGGLRAEVRLPTV